MPALGMYPSEEVVDEMQQLPLAMPDTMRSSLIEYCRAMAHPTFTLTSQDLRIAALIHARMQQLGELQGMHSPSLSYADEDMSVG